MNSAFTQGAMQGYGFVDAAKRSAAEQTFVQGQRQRLIDTQAREDADRELNKAMAAAGMGALQNGYGPNGFGAAPAPDATPGASKDGLAPVRRDTRTEEERAFDASRAMIDHAMKAGRADVASKLYFANAPLREKVREQAVNRAWTAYKNSGDPNALLATANRYFMDGINFKGASVIEGDDGTKLIKVDGIGPQGKPFSETMSATDFERRVDTYLDPDRARAAEMQRIQRQIEVAHEAEKARATKPKDFIVEGKPDENIYALTTGGPVRFQDAGIKPQVVTLNGAEGEGQSAFVVGGAHGGTGLAPIAGAGAAPRPGLDGLSGTERKVLTATINNVDSIIANRATAGMGDETLAALKSKAHGISGALMTANRGNAAANEGTLANVAYGLATGEMKPIQARLNDGGDVVDAVQLPDGSLIYTNPTQINAARAKFNQRTSAVANAPDRGQPEPNLRHRSPTPLAQPGGGGLAPKPVPKPAAAPVKGGGSDRKRILADELQMAQDRAAKATQDRASALALRARATTQQDATLAGIALRRSEAEIERAQADVVGIQAELDKIKG